MEIISKPYLLLYLLSGQFLNVQLRPGKNNDKTYGTICLETVGAGNCQNQKLPARVMIHRLTDD
ncbi:hypothetical protein [Peribacillus butanolivorans]|uniref:hypothetical protein n=1 Tax=Peribacillus butanolivorans TaxID=421767 RepID=UPI0035DAF714